MVVEKIKVSPEICSYVDEAHSVLTIEISVPGVNKRDILLRMHDDSMTLSAPRDDLEYVATLAFCCPVKQEKAVARYENGLLKIEVPFRDSMEGAVTVDIE